MPVTTFPPPEKVHATLASAAVVRMANAVPQGRPIHWSLDTDGLGGPEAELVWQTTARRYLGAETDAVPFRCGVVLGTDPARWQAMVDRASVTGHVAIVAPVVMMLDRRAWYATRLRPHTLLSCGDAVGVALVTRGRWPNDGALRSVLL
jgi:hypothetical protein